MPGPSSYNVLAGFTENQHATADCVVVTEGPCVVTSCTPSDGGVASPAPTAGVIDVAGGVEPVQLTPGGDGKYTAVQGTKSLFDGGEVLTYTAAGADVPAFQDTVKAPEQITVSLPAPVTPPAKLVVSHSSDLKMAWTGGGQSPVKVMIAVGSTSLGCTFDVASGAGSIPAAALAHLPAGTGGFSLSTQTLKAIQAGAFTVDLSASMIGTYAQGGLSAGSVDVQP